MPGTAPVRALIVVDVQEGAVAGPHAVPGAAGLLDAVADLLDRARRAGAFVVHLQNDGPSGAGDAPGEPGWRLHFPVRTGLDEVVVRKAQDDGFAGTGLGELLRERGVTAIAVCGAMSEMCVSATARAAMARGLRVVLPHDAHATYDVPPSPWFDRVVPAATAARAAEWALGDGVEIVPSAGDVAFA